MSKKEMIVFTKYSPFSAVDMDKVVDYTGKEYPLKGVTDLCRCGKSKKKPYCDGSHSPEGLNEKKEEGRAPDKFRDYTGKDITVHFNLGVCSHAAHCVKSLPEVFNVNKRPWINPDNGNVQDIIKVIEDCPSGALAYSIAGERHSEYKVKKEILMEKDGPLMVNGGIELKDDQGSKPATENHYTLCRCGHSKNKPFCDGSHRCSEFKDED